MPCLPDADHIVAINDATAASFIKEQVEVNYAKQMTIADQLPDVILSGNHESNLLF